MDAVCKIKLTNSACMMAVLKYKRIANEQCFLKHWSEGHLDVTELYDEDKKEKTTIKEEFCGLSVVDL